MKLKTSDLRKIIKEEYSRAVPEFAVRQIVDACVEDLKRRMLSHVNSKVSSQTEKRKMIAKMNLVLEDLEKELKNAIDEKVSNFFSEM